MLDASRFKLLKPFEKEDQNIFFGREDEVKHLYKLVHRSNLTLVYGLSGTGKTSLIRCGLANYFDPSEWHDIYIRRQDDINVSLRKQLESAKDLAPKRGSLVTYMLEEGYALPEREHEQESSEVENTKASESTDIIGLVQDLYKRHFKPIYLIFDQFEELFIGSYSSEGQQYEKTEAGIFTKNLSALLNSGAPCKVLLVIREESLGELIEMEKRVPSLYDNRMRVEPIPRPKLTEKVDPENPKKSGVIPGMCKTLGIELEHDQIPEAIVNALTREEEKKPVELTYLQVFLNRLDEKAADNRFTEALIREEGNIDDMLADFLQTQIQEEQKNLEDYIQTQIQEEQKKIEEPSQKKLRLSIGDFTKGKKKNSEIKISNDAVERILKNCATLQGTREHPQTADEMTKEVKIEIEKSADGLLSSEQVKAALGNLVDSLVNSRILSKDRDEDKYELTHDALARAINDRRSAEEISMIKIVRIVRERYKNFPVTNTYLTANEVDLFEYSFRNLSEEEKAHILKPEELDFVKKSYEKITWERFKRLFWLPVIVVGFLLFSGGGAGGFYAGWKYASNENPNSDSPPVSDTTIVNNKNANDLLVEYLGYFRIAENAMDGENFKVAEENFKQANEVVTSKLEGESQEVRKVVLDHNLVLNGRRVQDSLNRVDELIDLKEKFELKIAAGKKALEDKTFSKTRQLTEALRFFREARSLAYPYRKKELDQNIEDTKNDIEVLKNQLAESNEWELKKQPPDMNEIRENQAKIDTLENAIKDDQ